MYTILCDDDAWLSIVLLKCVLVAVRYYGSIYCGDLARHRRGRISG